jgi:L-lactate dehydrogenase complex protein LldF
VSFTRRADRALADDRMRAAIARGTGLMIERRHDAISELANADDLRDDASAIRAAALERLPELLELWSDNLTARGGHVHWAGDAAEATAIVADIVARRGARVIAKGKSMVSEEIHLNAVLERAGANVVETDLGEFIQQLAGEPPSHIIAPAMHKDRFQVADLLSADAGAPVSPEIDDEAAYARRRLRQAFLDAGVGITGVNFAVAATGSVCLVENEGNGRMCSSLPPTHIALMGLERIVADFDQLDVMLNLLARSATGQALTVYTNIISGPRRAGEADGPTELHVVVLDGGRSAAVGTQFSPALHCIRCGACLNVCPVYRQVGGHAYDTVYSGPIGAVLTPILQPDSPSARELPEASSLCGACTEICPVRIPLHDLLLQLRHRDARADASRLRRAGFWLWSQAWSRRWSFRAMVLGARVVLPLLRKVPRLPDIGWLGAWRRGRELP